MKVAQSEFRVLQLMMRRRRNTSHRRPTPDHDRYGPNGIKARENVPKAHRGKRNSVVVERDEVIKVWGNTRSNECALNEAPLRIVAAATPGSTTVPP